MYLCRQLHLCETKPLKMGNEKSTYNQSTTHCFCEDYDQGTIRNQTGCVFRPGYTLNPQSRCNLGLVEVHWIICVGDIDHGSHIDLKSQANAVVINKIVLNSVPLSVAETPIELTCTEAAPWCEWNRTFCGAIVNACVYPPSFLLKMPAVKKIYMLASPCILLH